MRRNWLSSALVLLVVLLLISATIAALSAFGFLTPIENLISTPLNGLVGLVDQITDDQADNSAIGADVDALRQRNAELERQLAQLQGEIIALREVASDYERLADLLAYTRETTEREYVTADVIGQGQYGLIRSIIINRGSRDGLVVGFPVVTDLGLVGRVWRVTANSAQVQLITDRNSFISGRMENSRAEGTIQGRGLETGNLSLRFLPLDVEISPGELVYTSGLGGNFPADIAIGQVISVSNVEAELTQEAQVASLIDFTTLEQVLVVTSFQPADLSVFDETDAP